LSNKTGRVILEPNINSWRRAVCGDLTSTFQKAADTAAPLKEYQARDPFFQSIHKAQFEKLPTISEPLTKEELAALQKGDKSRLPKQEPGTRPSSPLPYELSVDSSVIENGSKIQVRFKAGKERFGARSSGAPFIVYAETPKGLSVRHYTVAPGQELEDTWPADEYLLRIHGPNGFYRQYTSRPGNMSFRTWDRDDGNLAVEVTSAISAQLQLFNHYDNTSHTLTLTPNIPCEVIVEAAAQRGWYDVSIAGARAAGRVETGRWSITDPLFAAAT
jgi:phospholipase C